MKRCVFCAEEIKTKAIKCRYCGEMQELTGKEQTITVQRPAWRSYLKGLLLGALLLVVFGLGLIIWIVIALDRAGRKYIVTTKRVIVQKGIIARRVDEINISHIRSINMNQGAWNRIMGYGDLLVGTSGTAETEIVIKGIVGPAHFRDLIVAQKQ